MYKIISTLSVLSYKHKHIPQGSALGPLLFLVYVNAMPPQVRHGTLLQFADYLLW